MNETFTHKTYSIKEVARLIGCTVTTLRNWEEYFSIPIKRNHLLQREYTDNIVTLFKEIYKHQKRGLKVKEIKPLLNIEFYVENTPQSKIEIMQDKPEEKQQNFELIIKPYKNQIENLERDKSQLLEENKKLLIETATLKERCQHKDETINEYKERLKEIETKLNNRWWQFWKK